MFQTEMAENNEESGKPGWPWNSVDYLNRPSPREPTTAEEGGHSPWIGLMPMEGASPPDTDGATINVDEDSRSEPRPATVPDLMVRPAAPVPGEIPEQRATDNRFRPVPAPIAVTADARQVMNLSPETVTLYPRPCPVPVMMHNVSRPPPPYTPQAVPQHTCPRAYHTRTMSTQSNTAMPSEEFMARQQEMFEVPPPGFGRGAGHPRRGRRVREQGAFLYQREYPLTSEGTQTTSGVKPMFVKPNQGPAGMPDARVQCPACFDDRWYIDIITEHNPFADDAVSVLDSRMKCLTCSGSVWQVDLFTTKNATSTTTPLNPPRIHRIDRVMTPSTRVPPQSGQMIPQRVHARPFTGNMGSARQTPESGYGSGSATPGSDPWHRQASRINRRMDATEVARRSRAIRRLLYEDDGPDRWDASDV